MGHIDNCVALPATTTNLQTAEPSSLPGRQAIGRPAAVNGRGGVGNMGQRQQRLPRLDHRCADCQVHGYLSIPSIAAEDRGDPRHKGL